MSEPPVKMPCAGFPFGNFLAVFRVALNRSLSPLPLFFRLFVLPEAVCRPALLPPPSCCPVSPGRRRSGKPQAFRRRIGSAQNLQPLCGFLGPARPARPVRPGGASLPRGAGGCRPRRAPRPRAAGRPRVLRPLPSRPASPRDRLSCCPLRPWPPRGLPGGMPPAGA